VRKHDVASDHQRERVATMAETSIPPENQVIDFLRRLDLVEEHGHG
jgi:hypothetical protein